LKYPDVCEICAGLILKGIYPPNAIVASELMQPYDDMVRLLQKDSSVTPEKLIQKFGLSSFQAAEQASAALNGTNKADWLGILHESYGKFCLGQLMERNGRKLMDGKDADFAQITAQMNNLDTEEGKGILLSDVKDGFEPMCPCGYEPYDNHLGGAPHQGLSVVGAKSKSGKTTLLIDETIAFLKFQTKSDAAIFSLEMLNGEFKARAKDLGMPLSIMNRIVMWDGAMSAADVATAIGKEQLKRQMAGKRLIGKVGVDFADLMVQDEENSEAVFANIYRTMAHIGKSMKIPITLLSQLSGSYIGGLPKPNHLRYTRLAEALAWRVLMLYNPNTDWSDSVDALGKPIQIPLPRDAGYGYIIAWASRGGFGKHDGPGAIRMRWDGGRGWGKKSEGWYPLVKVE
jgi:hypothetical protein